jgi:4-hydroxybenzoyl-CoA thioesterase
VIVHERAVRFEDVDAAGIVFFARFLGYAHEAMEAFFAAADGGYVGLITERRMGFPAVRVEVDFQAPLRYGDRLRIETVCERLGTRSATLRYRMVRHDGVLAAAVRHTVVVTDLVTVKSCDMPADVRRVLEAHLEAG